MAKFVAVNIDWDVDMDEVFETLDTMTTEQAAEALGVPKETYSNMHTEERHDYAYDVFHHRPAMLDEFLGLPDKVEIPEEFGIDSTQADCSDVTDWLSDEYGYCINGYDVVEAI